MMSFTTYKRGQTISYLLSRFKKVMSPFCYVCVRLCKLRATASVIGRRCSVWRSCAPAICQGTLGANQVLISRRYATHDAGLGSEEPRRIAAARAATTDTLTVLCGSVSEWRGSDRPCDVTAPQTHSVLAGRRSSRMSAGARPTGCAPCPSCPLPIAPRCGGGAWWHPPRMGLA